MEGSPLQLSVLEVQMFFNVNKPLFLLPLHFALPQILDFEEVVEVEAVDFAVLVGSH